MSANFRFVVHAAERHANELASQRTGYGLTERRFTNAGRSNERENRTAIGARFLRPPSLPPFGAQFAHGEIFQNAVFDVFEVVMVLVQNLARVRNIEIVFGYLCSMAGPRASRDTS